MALLYHKYQAIFNTLIFHQCLPLKIVTEKFTVWKRKKVLSEKFGRKYQDFPVEITSQTGNLALAFHGWPQIRQELGRGYPFWTLFFHGSPRWRLKEMEVLISIHYKGKVCRRILNVYSRG